MRCVEVSVMVEELEPSGVVEVLGFVSTYAWLSASAYPRIWGLRADRVEFLRAGYKNVLACLVG